MYEEKNNSFSIRNVVIQFLFVALFIFIMIWLFPMKSDLKNALEGINKENNVAVFYDSIFNNNVVAMKDAAKSYYTNERLPKAVGESVKMTLGDMLEKKIILPFVDSKGEQCDLVDSYVEVTKKDNEFVMKVNLKCTDQENYLLVYMGCYDYCQTAICETNESDIKQPVIQPSKPAPAPNPPIINNIVNNNNNNTIIINPPTKPEEKPDEKPDPKPEEPEKEYEWEYSKEASGYWKESEWSEYSTTPVQADQYTAVRTKTTKQKVLTGYNVTTTIDKNKPIYSIQILDVGTETMLVCNRYDYVPTGEVTTENQWEYIGLKTYYEKPGEPGYRYEFVRFVDESCPQNCSSTVGRIYKVWKQSTKNLSEYKCVEPVYQTVKLTTEVKKVTGYEKTEIKEPVYEIREVKTYSYKKREYITVPGDTKWSIYNDTTLLNNGYKYTGNKREK